MSFEPTRRGFLAKVGTLPLLSIACAARAADAWPNRPVKVLVSYRAGGANDLVARAMETELAVWRDVASHANLKFAQ